MKELMQEYTLLELQRRKLNAELAEVEGRMEELEERLIEEMEESGLQSFSSNGITVYLRRTIRAYPKRGENETTDEAHQRAYLALVDWGWDDVGGVRINSNSLSRVVREYLEEHEDLPEEIKDVIDVQEKIKLGRRKA